VVGLGDRTGDGYQSNHQPVAARLIVAIVGYVVAARRELGAASPFGAFLRLGLLVITMRVLFEALLGGGVPGRTVLLNLPEVPLPAGAGGLRLGGPVTLEGVLAAACDGARLAAVLACIGAANALASPRRLLRYVPATLYEVGTALVVALTYAPQLVDDAQRVRAARRLRGHAGRGPRELPGWRFRFLTARSSARWIWRRRWSPPGTDVRCTGTPAHAGRPRR
jgi:energy-coupling factor transport system permease protein